MRQFLFKIHNIENYKAGPIHFTILPFDFCFQSHYLNLFHAQSFILIYHLPLNSCPWNNGSVPRIPPPFPETTEMEIKLKALRWNQRSPAIIIDHNWYLSISIHQKVHQKCVNLRQTSQIWAKIGFLYAKKYTVLKQVNHRWLWWLWLISVTCIRYQWHVITGGLNSIFSLSYHIQLIKDLLASICLPPEII